MSVYNNEATLAKAIDSILSQTYTDFIFYIVDDCSGDESPRILADYAQKDKRIQLITNQRHLGLTKSLNKALKLAKTAYLARMDADDISLPTRFAKQLQFMAKHQDIALLGTAVYLINDQGKPIGLKRHSSDHDHLRAQILQYCPFIHPTWILRRSVLAEVGGYNEAFPFSQDYELALRLVSRFKTANLAEPLLYYRVDTDQAISLKNLKAQERLALKARFLALTSYGYPVREAWKLIKPLLSYLIPVAIKRVMYKKFFWTSLIIFSLFSLSGCQKQVPLAPAATVSPSASATVSASIKPQINLTRPDFTNWKYYSNEIYHYKLRYPFNWQVINAAEQPDKLTISTVAESKAVDPHVIFQASVSRQYRVLADLPELIELKASGREPRQFKLAGRQALFLDKVGEAGDLFIVWVEKGDYILRLSWDGTQQDIRNQYKDICLQIITTLEFF